MNRSVINARALGELADSFVDGPFGSELQASEYVESGIPLVRIQNVRPNVFNPQNQKFIGETKAKELARHDYAPGDVLITKLGEPCGIACVVPNGAQGGRIVADVTRFRGRLDLIDHGYLAHFLNSPAGQKEVQKRSKGTTRQRINLTSLKDIPIPLPPLQEQRRIAAILDKADALRRKRKLALELLETLTQSIFLEMFGDPKSNTKGWREFHLGEVAEFFSGNPLPEGEPFAEQADGYLLLKVSDLNAPQNGEVIVSAASWNADAGSKAGTCSANAIVFPKRGGAIATNKKRKLLRPAVLDPNLMAVAPRDGMLALDFLYGWFRSFRLEDITSGSSVPQLNKQDLAPLKICVPPLGAQKQYSVACEAIGGQKFLQQASDTHTNTLFASLQHRAFSGQL